MKPLINQHNKLAAHILREGKADRVFIHGPSGVGKSTLAKAFAKPGDIVIDAMPGADDIEQAVLLNQDTFKRVIVLSDRPLRELDISDRCVTVLARFTSANIEHWSQAAMQELIADNPYALDIANEAKSPGHAVGLAQTVDAALAAGVSPASALRSAIGVVRSRRPMAMELILARVCDYYGKHVSEIMSQRRTKELVLPRHVAMYMCREHGRTTLSDIGKALGGRDHSSVLHACNKIKTELHRDKNFRAEYEACEAAVLGG